MAKILVLITLLLPLAHAKATPVIFDKCETYEDDCGEPIDDGSGDPQRPGDPDNPDDPGSDGL